MGRKLDDLTGRTFGKITVLHRLPNIGSSTSWMIHCRCGITRAMLGSVLRKRAVSCGCHRREVLASAAKTHGLAHKTPEYGVWQGMLRRCDNPRMRAFRDYGARGIKVCRRWKGVNGFVNFLADMGKRPSPRHTIERKNASGNYSPTNCQWLHRSEQNNNKRTSVVLTLNGKTMTVRDWSRETGISKSLIAARIKRLGWSVKEALTRPVKRTNY